MRSWLARFVGVVARPQTWLNLLYLLLAFPLGLAYFIVLVVGVRTGAALARALTWVDRNGREAPIRAPARSYTYPRLSPDGSRLAVGSSITNT